MPTPPRIAVVGSLNVDHTLRVAHLPAAGETLTASGILTCFGGKGANQAMAAARAGARVALLGCVGTDEPGTRYLAALAEEGIDTTGIRRSEEPTGCAFIAVDGRGENSIIVHPGANHALTPEDIDRHAGLIRGADALLLQLECPFPVVQRAAQIARSAGVPVLLNPSPLGESYPADRLQVDVLIVNAGEAAILTPNRTPQEARCDRLLITRGAESTMSISAEGVFEFPPPRVTPVDTVGAGDTFAGVYAVGLCEGRTDPVSFANAAAALATLTPGAQAAIPFREAILAMLCRPASG